MGYKWKPLQRAEFTSVENNRAVVEAVMAEYGVSREEAIAKIRSYDAGSEVWINDLYQVQLKRFMCEPLKMPMVHLNIRRRDGAVMLHDWRQMQLIKNQLVGEECEAVELYPAESRLMDEANKYHLWCLAVPGTHFPFGFELGRRTIDTEVKSPAGMRQRAL